MKDYVLGLRALVGHRPLIMAGACVFVLDAEGRILLVRRSDDGTWAPPGGMMEIDETVEETARREVFEEAGLTVGELRLFGVFSGPEVAHTYPNGDQVRNVCVVFTTSDWQGKPFAADEESFEARFFALPDLPEVTSGPNAPVLRRFREEAVQVLARHGLASN